MIDFQTSTSKLLKQSKAMEYITKEILDHQASSEDLTVHYPPSEVNKETLVLDFLSLYFVEDGMPKMNYGDPIPIFRGIWEKLGTVGGSSMKSYRWKQRYTSLTAKVELNTQKLIDHTISLKDAFMETYCVEDIQVHGF